jgi:predicted MFS family arabinose efflux permease
MAPLTGYRRWLEPELQLRSNAWMLMAGSLGLIAATLPVHWLMPLLGWRPLFWILAAALLVAMAGIAWAAPAWREATHRADGAPAAGYGDVWRHPFFRQVTPIGFFNYGGFVAMQTLWIVPWLTRVAGQSPREAAQGLFWISVALLMSYWLWGFANPMLARRGIPAARILAWGMPLSMLTLAIILIAGSAAGTGAWMLFCVLSTVVTLAQPAVGLALPPALTGRALSAYNLVLFAGIFVVQWGIGLAIDAFVRLGFDVVDAFRGALSLFLLCCAFSYLYFLWAAPHNRRSDAVPSA